ncbi:hypothetical protein GY45DRAFT_1363194 [Cubamyces sp. BRFM 1775]|nr:hypothetical protein GY45DRAFT_1363194 [Cubamyces sp. BRFM 1775]
MSYIEDLPESEERRSFLEDIPWVPEVTKRRIESFQDYLPTQFQQYGPLYTLFFYTLPADTALTKPQMRLRAALPAKEHEVAIIVGPIAIVGGHDNVDATTLDANTRRTLNSLRRKAHAGNISLDSTSSKFIKSGEYGRGNKYPDLGVCKIVAIPHVNGDKDQILAIIEVASVPFKTREAMRTASKTLRNRGSQQVAKVINTTELRRAKVDLIRQMLGYMIRLGPEGDRWEEDVVGFALIGTEVAFMVPAVDRASVNQAGAKKPAQSWTLMGLGVDLGDSTGNWASPTAWFSLYGGEFRAKLLLLQAHFEGV